MESMRLEIFVIRCVIPNEMFIIAQYTSLDKLNRFGQSDLKTTTYGKMVG